MASDFEATLGISQVRYFPQSTIKVVTEVDAAIAKIRAGQAADTLESFALDFKTEKPAVKETFRDLAEACVCFANGIGGTVVLGVRDKPGGEDALVGTSIDVDQLRSTIYDLTRPNMNVSVEPRTIEGKRLLLVGVQEGLEVYSTSKGEFRQRWQAECRPMAPPEVARLSDERRGNDWSAEPSSSRVADVDSLAIEKVRELLRLTGDETKARLARGSQDEICRSLGLVTDQGALTRSGELLLVANPTRTPNEVLVYQHRKTVSGEADFSRRWSGPLVLAFAEALEIVAARLTITPITVRSGQQLSIEDFPSIAIREALANALIHRDLRDNQPVHVDHSPAVLAIRSPGPLVAGVTPDNILTRGTKPRYPSLSKAFNAFGWGEYLGQGVNRMFREMARSGRPLPEITSEPDHVEVRFRGDPPNAHVAKVVAELPDHLKDDTDTLLVLTRILRGNWCGFGVMPSCVVG